VIRVVYGLYNALFTLLLPIIFLRLFWRGRKNPDYRNRWQERLGVFKCPEAITRRTGGLWLHAVSVGESIAAVPIIQQFQQQFPYIPITVTTTTPTGSKQIQAHLGDKVFHVYFPYDLPWTVSNFLKRVRPRLCLIMETELWPNCLQICQAQNLPVMIANARLSPHSMRGYQKFSMLTKHMLSSLTRVAAQSEMDGARFISLGLPSDRLVVIGNVKYDKEPPVGIEQKASALRATWGPSRPVWIAASTHAAEEKQVLNAFSKVRESFKDCLLILVPRHCERFQTVAMEIQARGFSSITRSTGMPPSPDTQVFLCDTVGELPLFYAAADIAFVGGSLVPVGGHNTLEPAMASIPCLVGPHVENFLEITERLKTAGALLQIQDSNELALSLIDWFSNPHKRIKAGRQGRAVVLENRGAVSKLLAWVSPYFV